METGQRIQSEAGRDAEEVMMTTFHLSKLTPHLTLLALANGQTAGPKVIEMTKLFTLTHFIARSRNTQLICAQNESEGLEFFYFTLHRMEQFSQRKR